MSCCVGGYDLRCCVGAWMLCDVVSEVVVSYYRRTLCHEIIVQRYNIDNKIPRKITLDSCH